MDFQTIQRAIDLLPRHHLTNLPTPLELCPQLSAKLGGPRIWIKRDDLTGLAFGGNKSRYLEFTLAEATAQGCDAAILSAVVQSNHCRQFAAACARLGLKGVVVLREDESTMGRSEPAQGNYLLDRLFGTRVRVAAADQLSTVLAEEVEQLKEEGYKPFTGLSGMLSRIAYIQCALEIATQCQTKGITLGHIVIGSGGNSLAGLVAGFTLLGHSPHFLGTPQSKMSQTDGSSGRIVAAAAEAAAHIGLACAADPARIAVIDTYVGTGFGYLDQATLDTIRLLAASEDIVFVHTGGTPLLFAYGEELLV